MLAGVRHCTELQGVLARVCARNTGGAGWRPSLYRNTEGAGWRRCYLPCRHKDQSEEASSEEEDVDVTTKEGGRVATKETDVMAATEKMNADEEEHATLPMHPPVTAGRASCNHRSASVIAAELAIPNLAARAAYKRARQRTLNEIALAAACCKKRAAPKRPSCAPSGAALARKAAAAAAERRKTTTAQLQAQITCAGGLNLVFDTREGLHELIFRTQPADFTVSRAMPPSVTQARGRAQYFGVRAKWKLHSFCGKRVKAYESGAAAAEHLALAFSLLPEQRECGGSDDSSSSDDE